MIGKVCVCRDGKIGIVTDVHITSTGQKVYCGMTLKGNPWQSTTPTVVADSLENYINDLVEEQVNAKMHRVRARHRP